MRCEELLRVLSEYVDGTVDPGWCKEFEQHLAGCNPCQGVVDNLRKTLVLCRNGEPFELPEAFRQRLHAVLRECWKQRQAGVE
ncbi:MAG: zf-HC2 domain-containing protein [Verrucomicrobiota bacterium]|nr:anti-sigma factor [Limisphaera sp.]MDW8382725.1 zf-HC2 domain-containing protein [Verrucomicrobiota bacterium]